MVGTVDQGSAAQGTLSQFGQIGENDKTAREGLLNEVQLLLGKGKIQIELDPPHWEVALTKALSRYRQRSANAMERSYLFFELQSEQQTYTLSPEIVEIVRLYRRGVGGTTTGGGTYLDPFALQYNNLYLLQSGGQGGLATFHMYADYQETIGRLFGQYINFVWDTRTKRLTIERRFLNPETIAIEAYMYVPDQLLINDYKIRPWLRDYTKAAAKELLAEIRGKFVSLPGPSGGIQLNASELKADAQQEMERLEQEIKDFVDSDEGWPFIIG